MFRLRYVIALMTNAVLVGSLLVFALVLGCASPSKIAPPAWLAERFFYALESVVVLGSY